MLRDKLSKDENLSDAEKAQWEIDFFNFVIRDGEINPSFQSTDDKGHVIEYPHFDRFNDQTYEYLINRFNYTDNIFLKARYAHILWFSPEKNGKYAKSAIDSYLKLIEIYEENDRTEPNEHYGMSVLSGIRNAYYIARQANDSNRIGIIKDKIKGMIYYYNDKSISLLTIRSDLMELMLEDKKIFGRSDFVDLNSLCIRIANSLFQSGNGFRAISFFEIGERIEERLKIRSHDYRTSIGECYEMMMEQNEKEPLISIHHCQSAIEYYKKVKNNKKIEQLEFRYKELKDSLKLESFKYQIDLTESIKKCKLLSEEIVNNNSSGNIICYLALNKGLLPKYKDMEVQAEQQFKDHPLQRIFLPVILDQNAHPAQKISGENAKFYKIIENYKTFL